MQKSLWQIFILSLVTAGSTFATPPWAKENTQARAGNIFTVVCSGNGPSVDLARREALSSCKSTAKNEISTPVEFKAVTILTEKDLAYHEQTTEHVSVTGLDCVPQKDLVEEEPTGESKVWVKCRFDLSKAKIVPRNEEPQEKDDQPVGKGKVDPNLSAIENRGEVKRGRYLASEKRPLSLASVPPCEDLLIKGGTPRVIRCDKNPMLITVSETDREILVRAHGYQPKTIRMGKEVGENVQVILDPL